MRQALEGMQKRLERLEQREGAVAAAAQVAAPVTPPGSSANLLHPTQVPGVAQPVLPQRESVADPQQRPRVPTALLGRPTRI